MIAFTLYRCCLRWPKVVGKMKKQFPSGQKPQQNTPRPFTFHKNKLITFLCHRPLSTATSSTFLRLLPEIAYCRNNLMLTRCNAAAATAFDRLTLPDELGCRRGPAKQRRMSREPDRRCLLLSSAHSLQCNLSQMAIFTQFGQVSISCDTDSPTSNSHRSLNLHATIACNLSK